MLLSLIPAKVDSNGFHCYHLDVASPGSDFFIPLPMFPEKISIKKGMRPEDAFHSRQ